MREVLPPVKAVAGMCGRQAVTPECNRLSRHCLRVEVDEGELWYHTMTGSLVLLSHDEVSAVPAGGDTHDELVARWYLVPEDFDEHKLAQQVRQTSKLLVRAKPHITSFVIFTTTDCNARCFYCYEQGRPRRTMTDEVAHDVAAYIARKCGGNDVRINWFGGEPLVNYRAIDLIVADLAALGIGVTSQMTTNGYLFTKELVQRARDTWNLNSIQVTLDGTEDTYNKTKAYVNAVGSPYKRVLDNIDLLADAGMKVNLRLNMSAHNEQDLWQLSDKLAERYSKKQKVRVYVAPLRDFTSNTSAYGANEDLLAAHSKLQGHVDELGISTQSELKTALSVNRCMADSDQSLTILPDGRLGKCEHESEERLVGSIYQDELDQEVIKAWKQTIRVPECQTCLFYPLCVRLTLCPWCAEGCTKATRDVMRQNLSRMVRNAYQS